LWEKAQLAGTLESVGVTGGQVLLAQEDGEAEGPDGLEGAEQEQIRQNVETADTLEKMGRPKGANTDGGFLNWLRSIENAKGSTVTSEQADAIVRKARELGLNVRLDPAHTDPNPWTEPHLNITGRKANAHVLVPGDYKLP
jgi:hypothetical protein